MLTRRGFIKGAAGVGAVVVLPSCGKAAGEVGAAGVLVNQVGFGVGAGKSCVMAGAGGEFEIVKAKSGKVVHRGTMTARAGDLGSFALGEFSDLNEAGDYLLRSGGKSEAFSIGAGVYLPGVVSCVEYFAKQRCGDSKTGWHSPCHVDDGVRGDNGQRQDASGGWHDACDLRKWVDATIYGMLGLSRVAMALGEQLDRRPIVEELRWGSAYFRKLQEPDGYVMNYCGGDDGNRWTDNKAGTGDDRKIHTEPAELAGQFHFVNAQASLARIMRDEDAEYARDCDAAAARCLKWCMEKRDPGAAASLSAAVMACAAIYRSSSERSYLGKAVEYAQKLVALQVKAGDGEVGGYFLAARDRPEPYREIQHGNLPLLALCEAVEVFEELPGPLGQCRDAMKRHVEYLATMAERSAFGTIPFGIYYGKDPGGGRRVGKHFYRWTMKREGETAAKDWWVGINAHLCSNGIGLVRAGRMLGDAKLGKLGQRQIDWVFGVNPFNVSTVTGVGRNQPALYRTNQFSPSTPLINGGVMNGLGGTDGDEICVEAGSWNTCEYWTPMVAYAMWLMAELTVM